MKDASRQAAPAKAIGTPHHTAGQRLNGAPHRPAGLPARPTSGTRAERAGRRYVYVSNWQFDAPVDAVWQALTDVESWPAWWPHVRRVQTLREGDADGLGAIRRIDWSTRLPYRFTLDVLCVQAERHRLLRGQATGDLRGEGLWELTPADPGRACNVRYTWRLDLNTPWMRWSAPLLAPVFRWNHEGVMRAGRQGLARRLAAASAPARA